jgi:hypothetical protein
MMATLSVLQGSSHLVCWRDERPAFQGNDDAPLKLTLYVDVATSKGETTL